MHSQRKKEIKDVFSDNLRQKVRRLFHVLSQFLFTTSEMELDYYHQKVNVRDASQVVEHIET